MGRSIAQDDVRPSGGVLLILFGPFAKPASAANMTIASPIGKSPRATRADRDLVR
jgi:hypothetical protein